MKFEILDFRWFETWDLRFEIWDILRLETRDLRFEIFSDLRLEIWDLRQENWNLRLEIQILDLSRFQSFFVRIGIPDFGFQILISGFGC